MKQAYFHHHTWRGLSRILRSLAEKYSAVGGSLIATDMAIVLRYSIPLKYAATVIAIRRNGVEFGRTADEVREKCGRNEVFAVVKCSTSDGKTIDIVVNEQDQLTTI